MRPSHHPAQARNCKLAIKRYLSDIPDRVASGRMSTSLEAAQRVGAIYGTRGPGGRLQTTESRRDPVLYPSEVSLGRLPPERVTRPREILPPLDTAPATPKATPVFTPSVQQPRWGIPIISLEQIRAKVALGRTPVPVAMPPPPLVQVAYCRTDCP